MNAALAQAFQEKGINPEGWDLKQIREVAKAVGLLHLLPRAEIVEYTTKSGKTGNYVKTPNYTTSEGGSARGLFVPADRQVVEAMIRDLFDALDQIQ